MSRIMVACVAACLLILTIPAQAVMTTIIEIGQGASLDWNGAPPPSLNCAKDGSDCKITITIRTDNIVSGSGNTTWILTGLLGPGAADIYNGSSWVYGQTLSLGNWTSPGGNLVVKSGDFTGVPAMTVPLDGLTTNSSGEFTFVIPQSSCTLN